MCMVPPARVQKFWQLSISPSNRPSPQPLPVGRGVYTHTDMRYKTAAPDRYVLLKEFARKNRKNPTVAEEVLWEYLRRNAQGIKFLRQHIIGDYIVDFVSRQDGLIIEVDGGYHSEPRQQTDDKLREEALEKMGYHVIRFTNEEILYNKEYVIEQIDNYFDGTE